MLPLALYRVPWIAQLHDSKTGVPYGAAMAPAALIVFPDTAWVAHAASESPSRIRLREDALAASRKCRV